MSRWFSLRRLGKANKMLALALLGAVLIGFLAVLLATPLPGVLARWSDGVCAGQGLVLKLLSMIPIVGSLVVWDASACASLVSAIRTLSCVVYFFAIYLILTRV